MASSSLSPFDPIDASIYFAARGSAPTCVVVCGCRVWLSVVLSVLVVAGRSSAVSQHSPPCAGRAPQGAQGRRALKVAGRDGLVTRNVAAPTDGVRLDGKRGRSFTPEQARDGFPRCHSPDCASGNGRNAAQHPFATGTR